MAEWHLLYCPKALIKPQYPQPHPTPPKKQTTTRNPTTFSYSTFSNVAEAITYTRNTLDRSDSPHDETRDDGSPGDTAGLWPFGVLIYLSAAAAQADQVYRKHQQAQTQTHRTNTC